MNRKFDSAQRRYDNAEPDDATPAIEHELVVEFIDAAVETLLDGKDVSLDGVIIVHAYELSDATAQFVVERFINGEDDDGMLGQAAVAAINYNTFRSEECWHGFFGINRNWCHDKAVALLEPHAEKILASIEAENDDY